MSLIITIIINLYRFKCSASLNGVQAMLNDATFKIVSQPAIAARKVAEMLLVWIPQNEAKVYVFEEALVKLLMSCIQSNSKRKLKFRNENMWTTYHAVRTSKNFRSLWELFLKLLCLKTASPIFCQYNYM